MRFLKNLSTLWQKMIATQNILGINLVMDNMQPNNNLYEDVVVIYQKLTKHSDPEKFFSAFYGKIVLESEKYVGVKNPQSMLITSKIAEKLLHYFKVFQQDREGSLSSSSTAHITVNILDCNILQVISSQI